MRTIAIANSKGGCGKTTTAVNLAAALAKKGMSVLIIDLDPQAHATLGLGHDPETLNRTVYHCLVDKRISISRVAIGTCIEGLKLAPSNILLTNAEFELAAAPSKGFVLADQLEQVKHEYEICVIDCPPSLGLLTLNALVASTDVIAPVQLHYYALESLKHSLETVELIRERFSDCRIQTLGLLLSFVESATSPAQEIEQQIKQYFGDFVFQTVIHRSIDLAEAPNAGQSILTYAPESAGAADYRALAEELCDPESQKKHRLTEEGPTLPLSDTARSKKSRPAAALASLAKIPHQVFHLRTMRRKVGLFLGLAILVSIMVSMIAATMVNHPPVADHLSVTTQEGTPLSITLMAADSDGNELTYSVVEGPSHGRLSDVPPRLTYVPASNYNGPDSFAYIVNDGTVDSNPATVSITVESVNGAPIANSQSAATKIDNPIYGAQDSGPATVSTNVAANRPPRAEPQSVTTAEDTSVPITLTGNDSDGHLMTYAVIADPTNGSLSGAGPDLKYTPNPNFNGSDSFTYIVNDGRLDSDPATVSITVTSVNDPPVAERHDATTQQGKPVTIDVLRKSSDSDNDSLTVAAVTQGTNGSVAINEDNTLTYTPDANFYGTDAFTYTISDGKNGTDTAMVNVTVITANNHPVITSGPPGKAASGVLYTYKVEATDQDVGDCLTYSLITKPTGMSINPTTGLIQWTPNDAQLGTHEVVVKVVDSYTPPASTTQSLTVTVRPVQPQTTTLTITDGYDEKNHRMLSAEDKTCVVQSRDGNCWETDSGLYTSYDFSDVSIPADSMIASVSIYVQHFEEEQFPSGKLQWSIGTGWPSTPVVWVSIDAPVREGKQNKAIEGWNVTSFVNTVEKVNSLQLRVKNNDVIGKRKTLVDYICAEVTWH